MTNGAMLILDAAEFAARKHSTQRRKDAEKSPFINHPLAVAKILRDVGIYNPFVIAAALLHDTIEDTDTTRDELLLKFGEFIAGMVLECTDDKSLPWEERKRLQIEHAASVSPGAKLVKLADKVANLRDLGAAPPVSWKPERVLQYYDWAEKVAEGLRGENPALDHEFNQALLTRANHVKEATA